MALKQDISQALEGTLSTTNPSENVHHRRHLLFLKASSVSFKRLFYFVLVHKVTEQALLLFWRIIYSVLHGKMKRNTYSGYNAILRNK